MELMPGYKQTEVGVIPEDWSVRRLGEIGESLIGLTYSPANVKSDGLLVLRSSNVAEGELKFENNVFVDVDVPDRIIVRKGDILICVRNGSRGLIGKCAKIDERAEGMTFGAFMAVFRTDFHSFVYHQFQSEVLKRQIHEHLGATINQITNASLNSFRIPFPEDEAEQRAIAGALADVDALLGALTQLIGKKRDLKQAAMQQLLTGQRRLPGFNGEWEMQRLGDLLNYERPDRYIVHNTEYTQDGNVPVLTANKSFVLGFTNESFGIFQDLPAIIFDDFTTDGKYVEFPFKVKSSAIKILKRKIDEVDLRYIFGRIQFIRFPVGEHKRHYISEYQDMELPIPKHNEQIAIAAVLSDMDAELTALEQWLAKTRVLKQGMMQELLTGKTRLL